MYGRRNFFLRDEGYEELCIISIYEARDGGSTDERAKSSIKIEKNWAEIRALGTPQVRGDEG